MKSQTLCSHQTKSQRSNLIVKVKNSTHEEIVTPLLQEFIKSYKDLPVCVYQIQNKFRNEKRAH